MPTRFDHNIFALKRRLEIEKGRPYTWVEFEAATGVTTNTFVNMTRNKTRRVDLDILAKIYDYLRAEGMDITPGDFIAVKEEPSTKSGKDHA